MEKIRINVSWCEKNFCASVEDERVPGAVVVTAKTYEELQKQVGEAVDFHVEGIVADGEDVPAWLANGDYGFDWQLDTSAIIRVCERYVSLAAISRASGVNERQLSHYANGTKCPRDLQRDRIIEGIHKIGRELMTV